MHGVLCILVYCVVWLDTDRGYAARTPVDSKLLTFTDDVKSVLSTTLVDELRSAQSNRSAVNMAITAPRNYEPPHPIITGMKPEIQFNNHIYPYHYERSYHYAYPSSSSTNPNELSVDHHHPYFRPKNAEDSNQYRYDAYNPHPMSLSTSNAINSHENANVIVDMNSNINTNMANNADKNGHYQSTEKPYSTSFPSSDALTNPEILSSAVFKSNNFPNIDFGKFRHNILGRPFSAQSNHYLQLPSSRELYRFPTHNYLYPPPDQNSIPPMSQNIQNVPEPALHHQNQNTSPPHNYMIRPYSPSPPSYFQPLPPSLPPPPSSPSTTNQSPYLSPFLGAFYKQDYLQPPYNIPTSTRLNIFNNSFTNSFPTKALFEGFYPYHNDYLPPLHVLRAESNEKPDNKDHPPSSMSYPSLPPPPKLELQPISAMKRQNEADPSPASSSNYEMKLFFPATRNDLDFLFRPRAFKQFTFTTKHYRI